MFGHPGVVALDRATVFLPPTLALAGTDFRFQRAFQRCGQVDVQRLGGLQQALVDADVGRTLALSCVVLADEDVGDWSIGLLYSDRYVGFN